MQVSNPNNIKIYNLSAGKSLPEWLSDRKKRLLQKKDVDLRKRIQLIQDFEMPGISSRIQVSKDGQYVLVTGIYKPRLRCYDVNQLSMKFERCFDSEVVKFCMLAEDYSKVVFLQADRYVEFHAAFGKYFRIRIPKFGRDLAYHEQSCDLYLVGAGSEIYRLNLEQGRFLNSLQTEAHSLNVCAFNPVHNLFVCGTQEGRIEAWDPRSRTRVGILDCALSCVTEETEVKGGIPSVTSLAFQDGLTMAAGTATGQILMYDIRSSKPLMVKDHLYGLPILDIEFHPGQQLVVSMDNKIVKLWDKNTGKPFTSIQATSDLNDLCLVKNTGMLFLANEDKKVLSYYIPSLGPAPKWCSFLDSLTEELEETNQNSVYDDYRFITKKELSDLGLNHLLGSALLRAYMHGYFIDVRLYKKAKSIADPFAYADYRRRKIREKVDSERENRVQLKKLPRVNRELAKKIIESKQTPPATERTKKNKNKNLPNLLEDNRFSALFENPDFQVDQTCDEFRLLNPLVAKNDKMAVKKQNAAATAASDLRETKEKKKVVQQFKVVQSGPKTSDSSEDEDDDEEEEEEDSSDDDRGWAKEVKWQHKLMRQEANIRRKEEDENAELEPKFYEIRAGESYAGASSSSQGKMKKNSAKTSLGERLKDVEEEEVEMGVGINRGTSWSSQAGIGGKSISFKVGAKKKDPRNSRKEAATRKHLEERKNVRRSAKSIQAKKGKKPGTFSKR